MLNSASDRVSFLGQSGQTRRMGRVFCKNKSGLLATLGKVTAAAPQPAALQLSRSRVGVGVGVGVGVWVGVEVWLGVEVGRRSGVTVRTGDAVAVGVFRPAAGVSKEISGVFSGVLVPKKEAVDEAGFNRAETKE